MKRRGNSGLITLLLPVLFFTLLFTGCKEKTEETKTAYQVRKAAEQIVTWRRNGSDAVITKEYAKGAGTSANDWFVFAMARLGSDEDYDSYYKAMEENVLMRYEREGGLDEVKATEWHRIGLTMLAMGKDPASISKIDFIGDGTYNRGMTMELDAQGINGYIWALLLLDAKEYEVPEDAYETREEIKKAILKAQEESGAWGLVKGQESIDLTAMALTALAPYTKEEEAGKAVRKAVEYLSKKQTLEGGFLENGTESSESSAQVIVALCSLGIDLQKDERFIKEGNTVLKRLLAFQQEDGGFAHSFEEADSNSMASEQACYALAAYMRYTEGKGRLYEFDR